MPTLLPQRRRIAAKAERLPAGANLAIAMVLLLSALAGALIIEQGMNASRSDFGAAYAWSLY